MKAYLPILALGAARDAAAACQDPGNDINAARMDLVAGETVMYICNDGFSTFDNNAQITLSCMDNQWGPINPPSMSPICIDVGLTTDANEATTLPSACPDPGLVDNADRWFDGFENGDIVFFSCKADFCAAHERTRTIEMTCQNGVWDKNPPTCVPCDPCAPPTEDTLITKRLHMHINTDFTASLTCDDFHVIKAGTSITDGTVECVLTADQQSTEWAPEIPTCSLKPQVVCGANEISIIINKNMLDSLGFTGGVNSLAMTGMNANTEIIMRDCQPTLDDAEENYTFNIESPYAGKCMTHFEHHMVDGMGNEANNYVFRNKIVWRQNSGAIVRSATVLDWTCEYEGLFTTGLDGPIKLALSTRTYIDKRRGYKQQEFTVSMGIYANKNYTNLLESSQVVHRGKRYFVAVWLHEEEKGTPFLSSCYGSPNEVSQEELIKLGRQPEPESQIRDLITEGCPAERTLTRLELPGSTADRRFSFMYPFIAANGYNSNYMYVHCEMKLRPTGYKPNCVRPAAAAAGSGLGGLTDETGEKLGGNQFFNRNYNQDWRRSIGSYLQPHGKKGAGLDPTPKENWNNDRNVYPKKEDVIAENNKVKITGKSGPNGLNTPQNNDDDKRFAIFQGRKRRRRSTSDENYAVSLGPMVMVTDENVNPEDIKEITIQTKIPMVANPDGTIDIDMSADPEQESYEFKYNTTYNSREDDVDKFKQLLPADRYVDKFDDIPGEVIWESDKQTGDAELTDENVLQQRAEDAVVAESIEEEILEDEEAEAENFAMRAIIIISSFLVGGIVLFAVAMYITMNTSVCVGGGDKKTKKVEGGKRAQKPKVTAVVAPPAQDEKSLNKSCGSSLTSQET